MDIKQHCMNGLTSSLSRREAALDRQSCTLRLDELVLPILGEVEQAVIQKYLAAWQSYYFAEEKFLFQQGVKHGITLIKGLESIS